MGNIVNGQVYGLGNGLGIFLNIFLIKRNPQYFTITIRTCFFQAVNPSSSDPLEET